MGRVKREVAMTTKEHELYMACTELVDAVEKLEGTPIEYRVAMAIGMALKRAREVIRKVEAEL